MSKYLTYNGQTHNYSEWARLLGISKYTIAGRLRYGMPIEKVLTNKHYKTGAKGRKVRCVETGVIYNTVKECAEAFYTVHSSVINNAKGKTQSCCGHHFEYVDD